MVGQGTDNRIRGATALLAVLAVALLLPLTGCLHESQLGPFDCAPSTGACRYEILRGDPYDELLLEISYVQGNTPDTGALDLSDACTASR